MKNLFWPSTKKSQIAVPLSLLPSLGSFYPLEVQVSLKQEPPTESLHALLCFLVTPIQDTLEKAKGLLPIMQPIVVLQNLELSELIMSDLMYLFLRACNLYFKLGYWHAEQKIWKPLDDSTFIYSRKILNLSTYEPISRTYNVDGWHVREPSMKNMKLTYDYIVWRVQKGEPIKELDAQLLTIVVYTCHNNNMTFEALESSLEVFLNMSEVELAGIMQLYEKLADLGITILGFYDDQVRSLSAVYPLPNCLQNNRN